MNRTFLNPHTKERVYKLAEELQLSDPIGTMDLALWPIGFLENLAKRVKELEEEVQRLKSDEPR